MAAWAGGAISTRSWASCKCNVSKSTGGRQGDGEVEGARGKSQSDRGEGERKREGESGGTAEVDTNEEPL